MGFNFSRVPSQAFHVNDLKRVLLQDIRHERVGKYRRSKIICLDSVTDAHNAAAIMRTASFYGVKFVVTSAKGGFGKGCLFSRIASGALEHLKIVKVSSLPKF